jgi:hypothetical protein
MLSPSQFRMYISFSQSQTSYKYINFYNTKCIKYENIFRDGSKNIELM